MQIDVVDADALDFDAIVRLQREAFKDVAGGELLESSQTADYYRWKYSGPAGNAKIALVTDGGNLVAMNSMFSEYLVCQKGRIKAWQSCDTATHPSARGRGYF